ncbi:MAG: hypothetical protein IH616_05490 [Gemmatimonadales bacterium]|nr:hypothetical protein [Gemmatimonadales bacterium]
MDLDVKNLNDPDAARALSTPGDVESLIAGSYTAWLGCLNTSGPTAWMSNASGEHVAPWGNFGMEMYARIPRIPTSNQAGAANVVTLTQCWYRSYRAIAAIADGLKQIESGNITLGTEGDLRAKAYGRFMQGVAHGTVALLYDSGFVYDETIDPATVVLQGYQDVIDAAYTYLDEAATLAGTGSFTLPSTWMSQDVTAATLARLARSWKASLRANVARTPADRAAVDWTQVAADANAGITTDFTNNMRGSVGTHTEYMIFYRLWSGWQMQNNWVMGMADQSGNYQAWINTATIDKQPFIIVTPDTRWPQGPDEATQLANPGERYGMNSGSSRIWNRPDRGTWRWSYYEQRVNPFWDPLTYTEDADLPMITVREMKALVAEAAFRSGNLGAVAAFVNETRTLHGLNATDAAGTNTSCVPKLPNGSCGNLWEMFKWEKRLETQFAGPLRNGFYFDGRGWGDLMEGTILQLPVPYGEMQLLGMQPYNFGGVGGDFAAPVGTYGY